MHIESDARILADGTLEGTLRMRGKGISDGRIRGVAAYNTKLGMRGYIEGWLGEISDRVELVDLTLSDHRDFTIGATMEITYLVPRFADLWGEDLVFHSPALLLVADNSRLIRLLGMPEDEERDYPVFMWAPQRVEIEESLTLPREYEIEEPEDWEQVETLASASLAWEPQKHRVGLEAVVSLERRLVTSDDFPGARDVAQEFKDKARTELYAVR
jgi:hypothetical protein